MHHTLGLWCKPHAAAVKEICQSVSQGMVAPQLPRYVHGTGRGRRKGSLPGRGGAKARSAACRRHNGTWVASWDDSWQGEECQVQPLIQGPERADQPARNACRTEALAGQYCFSRCLPQI